MGAYAVFGFYILSGYLMTLIMQRTYGYSATGLKKYAANRFLRIYPTYWVSVLITVMLLIGFGQEAILDFKNAMYWPATWFEWVRNIFIFFPDRQLPILTPPSWALTVELFFYLLIGLGLSRSSKACLLWFSLSLLYHVVAVVFDFGWPNRYYTVFAASLPFSIGACIYHFKDVITTRVNSVVKVSFYSVMLVFCVAFGINWLLGYATGMSRSLFFYTNLTICTITVCMLASVKLESPKLNKLDSVFGDYSYPIYLIHYQVAALVFFFVNSTDAGIQLSRPSIWLLVLSLIPILFSAWLIVKLVDHPINRLRNQVRKR